MRGWVRVLAVAAMVALLPSVAPIVRNAPAAVHGRYAAQGPGRDLAALDSVTSGIYTLPITTSSDAARAHFLAGTREADLGRGNDALGHFTEAVAADTGFALGYLGVANFANSLKDFTTNLEAAERHAAGASEAEQLQIRIARAGLDGNVNNQLELAQQLVAKYPDSPRAYLALAAIQTAMNRNVDARASIMKAVGLAPRLLTAHTSLGNSFLNGDPKDFDKALEHFKHAEALAPNEPGVHDLLGDADRALDRLDDARAEYTKGHELDPADATLIEQRGHVNAFTGNYAAARADYDTAIALGRGNEKGAFAPFRAFVNLYAGSPKAAIAELNRLVANLDKMGVPEPRGLKIGALTNVAVIAIHTRDFAAAQQALAQRTTLAREQADQVGTDAFRRGTEEGITYFDAWLAARKGDYTAANAATSKLDSLVQADNNPRKMEPVHQLEGFIALYQKKYGEAAAHLAQADLTDPYVQFQYATALEGAGDAARAKQIYRALAVYNFSNAGYALIRAEAKKKAS
jgi:Flp pilus assembly protein TadD